MTGLVAAADAAGWDAHRRGLAALRDTHWFYRDQIAALHTPGGDMTDTTDGLDGWFEADDDALTAETGDAAPDEIEGDFTDNTDADDSEEVTA